MWSEACHDHGSVAILFRDAARCARQSSRRGVRTHAVKRTRWMRRSLMALDKDAGRSWLEPWLRPLVKKHAALDAFFRKQFRSNSLATWFLRALHSQDHQSRAGWGAPNAVYYEFGIGRGRTMMRFLKALKLHCRLEGIDPYSYSIFGFDSFEGLPAKESARDDHPGWYQRQFHYSVEDISRRVA